MIQIHEIFRIIFGCAIIGIMCIIGYFVIKSTFLIKNIQKLINKILNLEI